MLSQIPRGLGLNTRNVTGGRHNHNHHLRDCLKYLVLSLPAQAQLEVRLAAMVQMAP